MEVKKRLQNRPLGGPGGPAAEMPRGSLLADPAICVRSVPDGAGFVLASGNRNPRAPTWWELDRKSMPDDAGFLLASGSKNPRAPT